jgi:hypothetical protein
MSGVVLLILVMVLLVYFLPTAVAIGKKSLLGVFIINFFLGWTFIGWVIALAWAVSSENNK